MSDDSASILVDLAQRQLSLVRGGVTQNSFPIAIGKPETPTPIGTYEVINKVMYPGGVYGSRWMEFYDGYGIHGTNQPDLIGQMVSHGCIRMHNEDVETVFPQAPLGTPVRIVASVPGTPNRPLGPNDVPHLWGTTTSPGSAIHQSKLAGVYTVAPGDTLWLIAQRFNTTVDALMATNQLTNPDILAVGQTLRLP